MEKKIIGSNGKLALAIFCLKLLLNVPRTRQRVTRNTHGIGKQDVEYMHVSLNGIYRETETRTFLLLVNFPKLRLPKNNPRLSLWPILRPDVRYYIQDSSQQEDFICSFKISLNTATGASNRNEQGLENFSKRLEIGVNEGGRTRQELQPLMSLLPSGSWLVFQKVT